MGVSHFNCDNTSLWLTLLISPQINRRECSVACCYIISHHNTQWLHFFYCLSWLPAVLSWSLSHSCRQTAPGAPDTSLPPCGLHISLQHGSISMPRLLPCWLRAPKTHTPRGSHAEAQWPFTSQSWKSQSITSVKPPSFTETISLGRVKEQGPKTISQPYLDNVIYHREIR